METKHTAGPWRANRRATYEEPGWVVLWPDTSKPGVHHRRLDYKGNFTEADARLIAAAPELLAALQDMVAAHAIPSDVGKDRRAARDKAIAAIDKATGGAE